MTPLTMGPLTMGPLTMGPLTMGPLTLPSPPWGRGDRLGEVGPDDHAGARAPGESGHVGEHLGGALGEGHGKDPRDQLRGATGARLFHALERALAEESLVVSLLQEIEEPEIELLVHPEVTRAAGLVRESSRGEDGNALRAGIRLEHLAKCRAHLVGARRCGNRGDGAV